MNYQCFTGKTLVSTEKGERVLKKVTKVKESETDVIVHVKTSDGKDINTTMFHPFMTEKEGRREWKAASNLQKGDNLITENGEIVYVEEVRVEKLAESVTVYNLEVEDLHVYYVAGVMVHNTCGSETKPNQVHHFATNKSKTYTPQFEEIVKKYDLDLDDEWNKDLLPHQGRHPNAYHDFILESMKQFDEIAQGNKYIFLQLFNVLIKDIKENPDMLYKDFWNNGGI